MKIDGKKLASQVLKTVKKDVKRLKRKKVIPHLAVILIGNDPASVSFIKQKVKAGKSIAVKVTVHQFKKAPLYQKIAEFIRGLNQDPLVHGIIIQRPLPSTLSPHALTHLISPTKDVDGFLPKSIHTPPLGMAVFKIFHHVYYAKIKKAKGPVSEFSKLLVNYLKRKNIVLLGRGETGGKPIAATLQKFNIDFVMLHSQIENREDYIKDADILVSAVGRSQIIPADLVKPTAWLIGVGVHKEKKLLKGDYDEVALQKKGVFYTPTPGGVGPVNVAYLIYNTVAAAKKIHKIK